MEAIIPAIQGDRNMTKNQAINYLYSSGFSKEQVTEIIKAFEPTTSLVDRNKTKEKSS